MSDQRLRDLERRWKETGSPNDQAAYLMERARCGDEYSLHLLETAAFGGSEIARAALGRTPTRAPGFNSQAEAAVDYATRESAREGGRRFDLHLLIGALCRPDSFACYVLAELGLSAEDVVGDAQDLLEMDTDLRTRATQSSDLLLLAHDERNSHLAPLTGTEHILLAILLRGCGDAAEILAKRGLVYWDTREALRDLGSRA